MKTGWNKGKKYRKYKRLTEEQKNMIFKMFEEKTELIPNLRQIVYNFNMGRKLDKGLIKESVEELEKLLKKEKDARVYRRIRVIYLIKTMENPKLQEIAEKVGIVKKTAFEYWDWYKKGGIENLKIKYKGRKPRLNKEELEKFKEKAKEGFDSLKSMQEWIKRELNKELSIKTISYWCKKLGIKKKRQTFKYQER